jgi:hypothetical protein
VRRSPHLAAPEFNHEVMSLAELEPYLKQTEPLGRLTPTPLSVILRRVEI